MKIKEVEKITHLSSQTIRFYEDKKLLDVNRDQSGYRDYTTENVEQLLKIKLLRKCGLTIQEIIQLIQTEINIEDILYQKISEYEKKDLELSIQKELCLQVINAKGDYQSLYEDVDYFDSQEFNEYMNDVIEMSQISLARQILISIPLFGPILCSYMFLYTKEYQRLPISMIASVIATIVLTLSWRSFLKDYRFQKEKVWDGIKHFLGMLSLVIGLIGLCIGMMILCNLFQMKVYMQEGVYILSQSRIYSFLYIILSFEMMIILMSFLSKFLKHRDYQNYNFVLPFIKKHFLSFMLINVLLFYTAFVNVTTVSDQSIVKHSFFHPLGIRYDLSDVEKVETGFRENGFPFLYNQGDFYYQITMSDGVKIGFEDCQTTKQYEMDTYSEMVVLDQQIMRYHPQKVSDSKNSDDTMLDQIYIDRFLSIIENK